MVQTIQTPNKMVAILFWTPRNPNAIQNLNPLDHQFGIRAPTVFRSSGAPVVRHVKITVKLEPDFYFEFQDVVLTVSRNFRIINSMLET